MRKWTYLVAAFLLVGTTATFTGCIDTDEPAGITDLRGAKAELIKAQAAVKLVEAEFQKAMVANQLLVNEGVALANKKAEINLEIDKLNVELKKLEVERDQAKTAEAKAKAESSIAQANKDKADFENQKAVAAEKFKADLLAAQAATAQAQEAYDNAIKAIEAAKLLMTDGEKAIVVKAQTEMESAAQQMSNKLVAMQTAQEDLNAALTDFDSKNLAGTLATKLAQKEQTLATAKLAVAKFQKVLETPISSDVTIWENEVATMKVDSLKAEEALASADVEIARIKVSAEYKAADKLVTSNKEAATKAANEYTKANTVTLQKIAKYENKSVANNATVVTGLKGVQDQGTITGLTGYANGVFTYADATYTEADYVDGTTVNGATTTLKTVENWLKLVDAATEGINLEDIAWSNRELNAAKTDATADLTAFATAKGAWETARDAYTKNDIPDLAKATIAIEAAISTWNGLPEAARKDNANISILANALKAYYVAADANIKKTNHEVTSSGTPALTKEISVWMLEDASYFANVVAPALAILVYNNGAPTIATANMINDTNKAYLVNLVAGTGQSLLEKFRAASTTVFGTLFDISAAKPRLTEVTEAEVRADAKANGKTINATNYGALGKKMASADEVIRMTNIIAQADAYKALRGALVDQQTALNAEIAANTAIVAQKLAAKNAADDAVKAAEEALKALTAKEEATKTEKSELLSEMFKGAGSVKGIIENKLKQFLDGKLTAEEFTASIKSSLLTAQEAVDTAEGAVAKAKKEIELYNKGQYTEAYAITKAQEELAVATKNYENAKVIYDKAVAQVKIVIDTLVK